MQHESADQFPSEFTELQNALPTWIHVLPISQSALVLTDGGKFLVLSVFDGVVLYDDQTEKWYGPQDTLNVEDHVQAALNEASSLLPSDMELTGVLWLPTGLSRDGSHKNAMAGDIDIVARDLQDLMTAQSTFEIGNPECRKIMDIAFKANYARSRDLLADVFRHNTRVTLLEGASEVPETKMSRKNGDVVFYTYELRPKDSSNLKVAYLKPVVSDHLDSAAKDWELTSNVCAAISVDPQGVRKVVSDYNALTAQYGASFTVHLVQITLSPRSDEIPLDVGGYLDERRRVARAKLTDDDAKVLGLLDLAQG